MSLIDQALQKAYQQRLSPKAASPASSEAPRPAQVLDGGAAAKSRELYVHSAETLPGRHFRSRGKSLEQSGDVTSGLDAGIVPSGALNVAGVRMDRPDSAARLESSHATAGHGLSPMASGDANCEDQRSLVADSGPGNFQASEMQLISFPEDGKVAREVTESGETWIDDRFGGVAGASVQPSDFRAAWEVDGFQFPAAVLQAENRLVSRLREALSEFVEMKVQVVWVSSVAAGEGRSTIATLLALALARMGQQPVLVQGDARGESLAKQLGVACDLGWNTLGVDVSKARLEDQCLYSLKDRLTLMPAAGYVSAGGAAVSSLLTSVLSQLSQSFSVVVVDAPLGLSHRNLMVADAVEVEVVVRDVRRTSPETLQQALWSTPMLKCRETRIVQNFT